MSPIELLYGKREAAEIQTKHLDIERAKKRDAILITGVDILYLLYEIPMNKSRSILPESLHPSVPAIMGITFMQAKDGPLGAFSFAFVGIACRTGIKPRHFILSAYSNSEPAHQFFSSQYGFPSEMANVDLKETYDETSGTIEIDNKEILDASINDCVPLVGAGGLIKYSPAINPVQLEEAALIQFEASYDFKRVVRGQCRTRKFSAHDLTNNLVSPSHRIAGSHAVVDLRLLPVRFRLHMTNPAENGGAKKV